MKHVIIGIGAAGMTAARTIRELAPNDEIVMLSVDEKPHSRCMLHKYLSHERDEDGLNFVPADFFEKNHIWHIPGCRVEKLDTDRKKVIYGGGIACDYDRLLIATGAESFIPPVGALRTAPNVFGLRHLSDAKAIDERAKDAKKIVIIGSGLVGLDAAYGLLEQKKEIVIVEMAERILPIQLDEKGAAEYQKRFEAAGCAFRLGRRGADTILNESGEVTHVVLDDGEKLPCDMVIVAAGVRSATAGFEDSGLIIDRGIQVDGYLETNKKGVYAAGDVTGLSGIWPNAQKQGKIAAKNMVLGNQFMYVDRFAAKNTINFFGLVSLCVGKLNPEEGDEVVLRESKDQYERAIFSGDKLVGFLQQGDISHDGIYQYLIKNEIDLKDKKDRIFSLSFGDFYGIKEDGEYIWN
ncbi:MAG TPA: FAD-dependent oxidoreductase [Candidatus Blautia faecavium]|uniref:FAD-dependent oxidoreductase n=1 Tax=Candidatus Blautia faecavium TaxID=2838487 RepID=A0A9D2RXH2_9FIRM|nr:FAD-dependent oxidoreductase [Candidatus Blautia faecavium]